MSDELAKKLDLAKRILGRWGQDWHKEGRETVPYRMAHNEILDMGDALDAANARIAAQEQHIAELEAWKEARQPRRDDSDDRIGDESEGDDDQEHS